MNRDNREIGRSLAGNIANDSINSVVFARDFINMRSFCYVSSILNVYTHGLQEGLSWLRPMTINGHALR